MIGDHSGIDWGASRFEVEQFQLVFHRSVGDRLAEIRHSAAAGLEFPGAAVNPQRNAGANVDVDHGRSALAFHRAALMPETRVCRHTADLAPPPDRSSARCPSPAWASRARSRQKPESDRASDRPPPSTSSSRSGAQRVSARPATPTQLPGSERRTYQRTEPRVLRPASTRPTVETPGSAHAVRPAAVTRVGLCRGRRRRPRSSPRLQNSHSSNAASASIATMMSTIVSGIIGTPPSSIRRLN